MKILNIYFKNINSLEGESRIHFDQPPIGDGGVFAITGPNGSGKSSILDVITLALYGETFRFDRPADHVMTKLTTESFAHVEFSLGDDVFRSSWQVKRENGDTTGALLPSEMKLVKLNGSEQLVEESSVKVRNRMTEITGMDFHKFCKSMVLAQGDFAAFLNALDSERMDILEKISGSEIYTEYKQQAEEKNAQAQSLLQQLEQDLNALPLMDAATREAHEQDLEDFKEQQLEFEKQKQECQQQLTWTQHIKELDDRVGSLVEQQQQLAKQTEESENQLQQIETSQDAINFEAELTQIDDKTASLEDSKKTLDAYLSELELLQKQLHSSDSNKNIKSTTKTLSEQKGSIDQLKLKLSELKSELPQENTLLGTLKQQLDAKKSDLQTTEVWLQDHQTDKSLLDNFPQTEKLTILRTELAELSDNQKAYTKWSDSTAEDLKKKTSSFNSLTNKCNDLKAQILADEKEIEAISEGYSFDELREMVEDQKERVIDCQELCDLANVNAKLGKKGGFGKIFSIKSEHKEEKQLTIEADQLQLKIAKEQTIVEALESAVFNESLLQKMQADREHLIDGNPCPLCGALKHPYAEYPPAISSSKQALKDQQKKVKELSTDAQSLAKKIVKAQKQAELDEQKEGRLQLICSQWSRLANKLNVASMDLDIDNHSLMKDLVKKEKTELSNLSLLIKKYSKRQQSISQAQSSIEANDVTISRLTKEKEELVNQSNSRSPQESEDLEQAYAQCLAKENVLTEQVVQQLNALGEELPTKKAEENALNERLQVRRQQYQRQSIQHKTLVDEIRALEQKASSSETKIEQITADIEQHSTQVAEEEIVGLHLSLTEKQKLIAEKETVFSQQESDLAVSKQALQDKTRESAGGDLSVLRETIALLKNKPAIQQKQLELTQNLEKTENKLEQSQTELELEQAKALTNKSVEELVDLQKSYNEKLDIVKQEKGSVENKLSKQSDLLAKHEQVLTKMESQKKIADAAAADIKLINDDNGLHFREKVQQALADKLLSQSNQILEKISGRYYVRKVASDHGLAIEIEDTKQQNVRRLPKTLSGGESFIVSLALALGLAEMGKKGHAVDSLFLDEGFGNLDAEALYLVMTTLESLKTHGKVVGVISHVEAVKKRIKTQIEMIKKPNGLSGLKIVS